MHKVSIPQSIIDRVILHRGREHVYEGFDPLRTALLVVDMQNAFMLRGVGHAVCDAARDIVANVNRLARGMREAGGLVAWIMNTFNPESLQEWPVLHEMTGPGRSAVRIAAMREGSKGHELWAGLETRPGDLTVKKTRYSAFAVGASDLAQILRSRGIENVIVTGTVTNVCCDSTARDAMMCNFRAIMVTDANAANSDEEHNAALIAFYTVFGDIMSTDMVLACLSRNAAARHEPLVDSSTV